MKLKVIFGQRIERYEGQYAPEALEIMTEYDYSDNPEWLHNKLKEYTSLEEFYSVEIVDIEIDDKKLNSILYKKNNTLEGEIK